MKKRQILQKWRPRGPKAPPRGKKEGPRAKKSAQGGGPQRDLTGLGPDLEPKRLSIYLSIYLGM